MKTVAEKLLIKPNTSVWLSEPNRLNLLGNLPEGSIPAGSLNSAAVAVLFAEDASHIRTELETNRAALTSPQVLWVLYPKGNKTDINRDSLAQLVAEYGLRPITQVAIDDTWSALRFRPLKEGEEPFRGGS